MNAYFFFLLCTSYEYFTKSLNCHVFTECFAVADEAHFHIQVTHIRQSLFFLGNCLVSSMENPQKYNFYIILIHVKKTQLLANACGFRGGGVDKDQCNHSFSYMLPTVVTGQGDYTHRS